MQDQEIPSGADGSVGMVRQQTVVSFKSRPLLNLDSGRKLGPITQVYETYGRLNRARSNAVLVFHALSGDHHAAGKHSAHDSKPGWWDNMIGPGKAFDTNRLFVICANVLGGCRGTTGPASTDPATGRPYGLSFPVVTLRDMVRAQKTLVDHLGIRRLLAVSGASMGGMMALQWAVDYPKSVRCVVPIATAAYQSPKNIALQDVGRRAIMSDPDWNGGQYYGRVFPARGLAVARMIGHISYLSGRTMYAKFGRRRSAGNGRYAFDFAPEFQVETYLQHQSKVFVNRFDPNSYLYITKAIDYFDLTDGNARGKRPRTTLDFRDGDIRPAVARHFKSTRAKFLVLSFTSDWLYPVDRSIELSDALKMAGREVHHETIQTTYGHDACFLEANRMAPIIRTFLGVDA